MSREEKEYHRKRTMFCLVGHRVYVAKEKDERSHREWMEELGLASRYEKIVRGVVYKDKLSFYRGEDWQADREAEKIFFENIINVARGLELDRDILICGGCIVGEVGEIWPPRKIFGELSNLLSPKSPKA